MTRIKKVMICALLGAAASGAVAQPAAQGQPAPNETPQRTTASYGDWVVQCETAVQPPHRKLCEMDQSTQVKGNNLPFSRVALAHPIKGQPVKLVVQLPVNVSFDANVRIQTSDADTGIAVPFARCTPGGCFADFEIKEEILKKLRTASGAGKLSFLDAGGRDINVPLSFNGFAQAFDALSKE